MSQKKAIIGIFLLMSVALSGLLLSTAGAESLTFAQTGENYSESWESGDLSGYSLVEDGGTVNVTSGNATDGNKSLKIDVPQENSTASADYNTGINYNLTERNVTFDADLDLDTNSFDTSEFELSFNGPNNELKVQICPYCGYLYRIRGDVVNDGSSGGQVANFDTGGYENFSIEYNNNTDKLYFNDSSGELASGALQGSFDDDSDISVKYKISTTGSDSSTDVSGLGFIDNVSVGESQFSGTAKVTVLDEDGGVLSNRKTVANATVETIQNGTVVDKNRTVSDGVAEVGLDNLGQDHYVSVSVGGEERYNESKNLDNGDNLDARIPLYQPAIDNASADPTGVVAGVTDGTELKINVTDRDMPTENVTAEFYDYNPSATSFSGHDLIASDEISSNGTANVTWDAANETGKTYSWIVKTVDEQELTNNVTSKPFSFEYDSRRPLVSTPNPSDGAVVSDRSTTLSVRVDDLDLPNDDITVEFYEYDTGDPNKDTLIGSDSTASKKRYSTSHQIPASDFVEEWYAVANDSYSNRDISSVYSIGVSGWLNVNDTDDGEAIADRPVEIRLAQPNKQKTVETNNGSIKLPTTELSGNEEINVRLRAAGYYESKYSISSVVGNVTTVMQQCPTYSSPADNPDVHDDCDPDNFSERVGVTFELDDKTGDYPPETTRLEIRGGTNASADEKVLLSSRFGGANSVSTSLQKGDQYSLRVINENGDVRSLGNMLADANETITLTVGEVDFGTEDPGDKGYIFDAKWLEGDNGKETIAVTFEDSENLTNDVNIKIYERGNESNVLKKWEFARLSNFTANVFVPPEQRDKVWVVELDADRDDGQINGKKIVGEGKIEPQLGLDPFWQHIAAIGMIVLTAGVVGGGVQAELGSIMASVVAGLFFVIGWLPGSTTGGMIVLALFLSIMWRIRGPTPAGVR